MTVTELDAWTVGGTYATEDATFSPSAGSDRCVIVCLSAEKNTSGPIAVTNQAPVGVETQIPIIAARRGQQYRRRRI